MNTLSEKDKEWLTEKDKEWLIFAVEETAMAKMINIRRLLTSKEWHSEDARIKKYQRSRKDSLDDMIVIFDDLAKKLRDSFPKAKREKLNEDKQHYY